MSWPKGPFVAGCRAGPYWSTDLDEALKNWPAGMLQELHIGDDWNNLLHKDDRSWFGDTISLRAVENGNEDQGATEMNDPSFGHEVPNPKLAASLSKSYRNLRHLSVHFVLSAQPVLDSLQEADLDDVQSLRTLSLTTALLRPLHQGKPGMMSLLLDAKRAVERLPNLQQLELWSVSMEGGPHIFKYQVDDCIADIYWDSPAECQVQDLLMSIWGVVDRLNGRRIVRGEFIYKQTVVPREPWDQEPSGHFCTAIQKRREEEIQKGSSPWWDWDWERYANLPWALWQLPGFGY